MPELTGTSQQKAKKNTKYTCELQVVKVPVPAEEHDNWVRQVAELYRILENWSTYRETLGGSQKAEAV